MEGGRECWACSDDEMASEETEAIAKKRRFFSNEQKNSNEQQWRSCVSAARLCLNQSAKLEFQN